jgi:hypothetical protein
MAFLHNNWDDQLTIDAVLTDTGRMRMAKADGSFKIVKFAFGDEEINYTLYDRDSGGVPDTNILLSPVFEPVVNNAYTMKYRLLTLSVRSNGEHYLYLPVIRRNKLAGVNNNAETNILTVLVDKTTQDTGEIKDTGEFINGYRLAENRTSIVIDQGIETGYEMEWFSERLEAELVENQYIIEIDNRVGYLADPNAHRAIPSFIDDDNVASYYLSPFSNTPYFATGPRVAATDPTEIFLGPKGDRLKFLVGPSTDLMTSNYLFVQLGNKTGTLGGKKIRYVDTVIRITGVTTGQRVDLPIRFVKRDATLD